MAKGVCMVKGYVWQKGGIHSEGGHMWQRGGMHGIQRDMEIRSMSGRYASYWNAFLFGEVFARNCMNIKEIGPRGSGHASLIPALRSANENVSHCGFKTILRLVCGLQNFE